MERKLNFSDPVYFCFYILKDFVLLKHSSARST